MLDTAKENLQKHFAAAGVSERFDEFLRLVQQRLGWGITRYKIKNAGHDRPQVQDVDAETRAVIVEHNQLDIALYRYAAKLFEQQLNGIL